MAPIPTLFDLIRDVLLDGVDGPRDPIRHIAKAEQLAGELSHLGEGLVGFFVEQARAEGVSWAEIGAPRGLSRQGAQQRYAPLVAHLSIADLVEAGTLREFGEAAMAVVHRAEAHALRLDSDAIDSGDLLLALLDDESSTASAALRELGVDLTALRTGLKRSEAGRDASDRVDATGSRATSDGAVGRAIPLSPEVRRALDGAAAEARGHLVAPGHLLLGVLRNPGSRAGRLLAERGVTKSSAMGAILSAGSRDAMDRSEK